MQSDKPLEETVRCAKWLGTYLLLAGVYHVSFYVWLNAAARDVNWQYRDPRMFLDLMLAGVIGEKGVFAVGVLLGCWLFSLGVLLITGRSPIKTYILSELLLSVPALLPLSVTLFVSISGGGHGVPGFKEELVFLLFFAIFSAIPLLWAIKLWRANRLRGILVRA